MTLGVRGRLFAISLLLIIGVGVTTGAFFESRLRDELRTRLETELLLRARTAAAALERTPDAAIASTVARLAETTESHVAVIGRDGAARARSEADESSVQVGPEVDEAFSRGVGRVTKWGPEGIEILVVAVAYPTAEPTAVVRLALPLRDSDTTIEALRALMLLAALVGLAVAVFMSGVASELMTRTFRRMVESAVGLATGATAGGSIPPKDEDRSLTGPMHRVATDLEEAVSELAAERDQIETILERMTEAVLALDANERITIANSAAFELLDFDDDDVGRPLLEAVRLPALLELARKAIDDGDANVEFELPTAPHRQLLAKAAPLETIGGVVIVMHDMTEIRRLERVRRDFVANVSHELRTPITVIRANAETLLDGALEDRERGPKFVEAMHRSAERLSRLVADLLDLSRIEAGHFVTELQPVRVARVVDGILEGLEAKAIEQQVDVAGEVDDRLVVQAASMGLSQVLQNLLDNAIKYTPAGGHVIVRARAVNDVVRIEVEDDGPGIEPHHRERIFERFYRVDTGRSRAMGGTGLGLSIVRHLAEQMNGRVGVDPGARRGSIFWIELQAVPPVQDADEDDDLDTDSTSDPPSPLLAATSSSLAMKR